MKLLAFNGSPRLNKNTATMLDSAIKGAQEQGADVELVNLYKIHFSGCVSCFECKRLYRKKPILCPIDDDLKPILEKVRDIDALLIGSPVYFGCETAATRALIERLCFPYLNYLDYAHSYFQRKIPVGLIYTMNVPRALVSSIGYSVTFENTKSTLARQFGSCKIVMANHTTQYDDYSLYESYGTDEIKRIYRETHFERDCQYARELGEHLATGEPF